MDLVLDLEDAPRREFIPVEYQSDVRSSCRVPVNPGLQGISLPVGFPRGEFFEGAVPCSKNEK